MPPYTEDSTTVVNRSEYTPFSEVDVAPAKPEEQVTTESVSCAEEEEKGASSIFDFNLCTGISGAGASMQSAVFKARPCAECGKGCSKIQGYNRVVVDKTALDEETGEPTLATTKVHYHKKCTQIKEWRFSHSESYITVMESLLQYFREKELAARRKKEAEERARLEAIARAKKQQKEAQRKREEAAAEEARLKAFVEQEEEQARQALQALQAKKERKLTYRIKKAFSNGCKSKKAVDEAADGVCEL